MSSTFESLGLAEPLLRAVAELGFTQPTAVQAQAIPAAMQGGDWMVSSQTGSGKTAAFLLPALHALIQTGADKLRALTGPQALVLCPTRELAQQVANDAIDILRPTRTGLRVAVVVGGMPFGKQIQQLRGATLVIATPGRLLDLADRRAIRLDQVQRLVVDEADRMLDLGFADDLEAIHRLCEGRGQTLMFSATFAPRVMQLASRLMDNPGRLELATAQDAHADIAQTLHWADDGSHKRKLLDHWLSDEKLEQAVIFASTQVETEALAADLAEAGHQAAALHGAMPQVMRNRRLQMLRDGRIRVLVATDVAARGIDVPAITHVINFGLPMKAEDYVHRIGRTGRAGRSGQAITLAEPRDRGRIRAIEALTRQPISVQVVPGLEPAPRAPFVPRPRPGSGRGRPGGPGRGFGGGFRREGSASGAPRDGGFGAPREGGFGGGRGGYGEQRNTGGYGAPREGGFGGGNREGGFGGNRGGYGDRGGYGGQREGGFGDGARRPARDRRY